MAMTSSRIFDCSALSLRLLKLVSELQRFLAHNPGYLTHLLLCWFCFKDTSINPI